MVRVIDCFTKPPCPETLPLRMYSDQGIAGVMASRHRRNQPPDPAVMARSLDLFLSQQTGAGITRSLVSGRAMGPGFDPGGVPEELSNADVARIVARAPDHFGGLASYDPIARPEAPDLLADRIREGFLGCVMYPGWMPERSTCDDPRQFGIYETCIALDVPVVLLNGGFAGPDLSYGEPVHVDRLAAQFPKLKIVLAHAAYPNVQEITGLLYRRQNIWLQPDMYFPAMPGEQDFILAMTSFARERMIFSSAYPMVYPRDQIERVLRLGLPPTIVERYLYHNAADLFGI